MKHLKSFEHTIEDDITQPQKGDYVICHDLEAPRDLGTFYNNTIGQIVSIYPDGVYPYYIEYKDADKYRNMKRKEIIHFSPNKEDLELILNLKKYNL